MEIGNYEIVEQIGAGAMGVVYKARHLRVRRTHLYALKLMHSVIADRPDLVARFHREIEVVGRLEHPNIVSVVDAGEHQGSPYLVMEYLQGEPLEKYIHEKRSVSFDKKLEIMAAVCRGLDYAHKQGVVHRDIKPANIILLPDLTPKIVDFGVAHIADNTMTRTGLMVGTVSYMSPEQLNGARVDGRSDIFSTTIVLYEFLSNHLPFEGADTAAIMKKILMDAPPPLREFVEPCPLQVEMILARGFAKEPANRYATALDMAMDLDKVEEAERLREAAADAAMQATVLAPAARKLEKPAEISPPQPAAVPEPRRGRFCSSCGKENPGGSVYCISCGRAFSSIPVAAAPAVAPAASSPSPPAQPVPKPETTAAQAAAPAIEIPKREITETATPPIVTPADKTEVSAPTPDVAPPRKRRGRKWLLGIGAAFGIILVVLGVLSITGHPGNVRTIELSPFESINCVAFSKDGRFFATGSSDHTILLWDTSTWHSVRVFKGHTESVRTVAFSDDGKYLASGGQDDTVRLWDVATGNELRSFTDHTEWVWSVVFSPNNRCLATAGNDKTIKLRGSMCKGGFHRWDEYIVANPGDEFSEVRTLSGHTGGVFSLAFSPDGKQLASGSKDDTIKIWDVANARELQTLSGHGAYVNSVAFSPDGRSLASGSFDMTARIWDVAAGRELRTMNTSGSLVESIAFSPDGHSLASAGGSPEIELWDPATGLKERTLHDRDSYLSAIWQRMRGNRRWVDAIAFSPDGHYLVTGEGRGIINLWDLTK